MTWLNLTPIEFATVFALAATAAVWLYLLHQLPKRQTVSTLRFWQNVQPAAVPRRRRRIQHPWALLAQLLFLLLLMLALANLRRDASGSADRSVVLMVDGSVWSQVRPDGGKPWIEQIRAAALDQLNRLGEGDPVALVRADSLVEPLVPFTTDRALLRAAIAGLQPSDTTADLPHALEYGDSALTGRPRPTLVYVGPGMIDEQQRARLEAFQSRLRTRDPLRRPHLIVRAVGSESVANRGITRLAVRRDGEHPDTWHLLAQIRNYSIRPAAGTLRLAVNHRTIEERQITLAPHESAGSRADLTAPDGGLVEAVLNPGDALGADDRAVAYLPAFRPVRVAVITRDPKMLKPVLAADPYIQAEFVQPGAMPLNPPDVTIYDAVAQPSGMSNAIEFVRGSRPGEVRLTSWNPQHPVTRWIRTRDISVRSAAQLTASPSDTVLAWAGGEPLVLAHQQNGQKQLLLGFDPRQSNLPLQPAFPLLLASSIEWLTQPIEEGGDSAVSGELTVEGDADGVYGGDGLAVPFARDSGGVQLLAARAGVYTVRSASHSAPLAVNVPPLPGLRWAAAGDEDDGLPPPQPPHYYWHLFALLALLPLWAEWVLYYRSTKRPGKVLQMPSPGDTRRAA